MPAIFVHGFIGYILFGNPGIIYSILPDMIGFSRFFIKLFKQYKYIPSQNISDIIDSNKMDIYDWYLYDISHSLVLWTSLLLITKNIYFFAPIINIIFDIFLHSSKYKGWRGPKYLYPFSDIVFDGIHWNTIVGWILTFIFLLLLCKNKLEVTQILKKIM